MQVRLWHGRTGKFVVTLRNHVGAVYQLAWAADSRLLASGSKDSTVGQSPDGLRPTRNDDLLRGPLLRS